MNCRFMNLIINEPLTLLLGRFNGPPLTVSEFRDSLDVYLVIYLLIGTFMMLCSFVQVS